MIGYFATTWSAFNLEGRVIGSFVYMLLCRDESKIYIKVGHSIRPERRFHEIRNNCPVTPRTFYVIPMPGAALAKELENTLHDRFDKWRVSGEWFAMTVEDKEDFNRRLRDVLSGFSMPSWPVKVDKVPAKTLIKIAERRKAYWQHKFRRGGKAYQDFVKDAGRA